MRKLSLLLGAVLFCVLLMAQQKSLSGKILDDTGVPVAGATISVKGKNISTISKADGTFLLQAPADATDLLISYVGYVKATVAIGQGSNLVIALKKSTDPLDEVVVVGYQSRKKRDEAGAISSVRAKQIENLPNVSLDKALQGQAAGVQVQSNNGIPGGAITVRIRGAGSINAGNDPLYIVDGIQLNVRNDASFTQSNPLSFLNPDDIESIDVIKDAASAAIYGSNAANGVVIITTKKGKAGKTKFIANAYYGQVSPLKYQQVANAQQYFQLRAEGYGNANNLAANSLTIKRTVLNELRVPITNITTDASADSAIASLKTYDWQRAAIGTSSIKNYELSASGGNDKTNFRISGNYTDQGTIVTKADFRRIGVKADITNKATDRLTFGSSINLSSFEQQLPFAISGSFLGSPAFSASGIIPTNPIYNPDGSYYGIPGATPANIVGILNQNIIAVNDFNSGFQRTNQIIASLNAEYKLTEWLSWRAFVGLDYRIVQGKQVRDARTPDAFTRKGLVNVQSTWNTNLNTFTTLNFNKTFGAYHKIDGLAGFEYRKENQESISASGDGFPTYQFVSLNNAANPLAVGEFFTGFKRNAFFGNLNYTFNSKYILGLVARYDGSSRFGSGNRYGFFSGIKAAWNIDQEKFLEKSNVISAMRLRASYGTVGNDQIGNFDGLGLFGGSGVYNGGAGIAYTQLANANLKWESTSQSNLGLDFGFFNNRINGSFEVYNKQTKDVLLTLPLQNTTGFGGIASNIGKTQNKGVEVTLTVDPIRGKKQGDFNWSMTFIFAYNKQSVKELYGGFKILPSDPTIRVGEPINVLFTQKYAGVNAATGRAMWFDTLGNLTYQVQARDRVVLGPTLLAPYQGGFRNTFSYKGLSLNLAFNYEYGRYSTDGQINFLSENQARINELTTIYDKRWTTPGQVTTVPRFNVNGAESKGSGAQSGNRTFFKADYVRLRNITLAYDLPASVLSKVKLNSAGFYIQGTNLYTYADAASYDVEFVGVATGIIPQTKNITVGVKLGF